MNDSDFADRIVLALDLPIPRAKEVVLELEGRARFFKLGLETFSDRKAFSFLDWLLARQAKVFIDLKLYDIPRTVGAAARALADSGASFLSVHGDKNILEAAVENCGSRLKILSVSLLSSLDQRDVQSLGYAQNVSELVCYRARQAKEAGCHGVVASGNDIASIRKQNGKEFAIFTPAIRMDKIADDQKRTLAPEEALRSGSDYLIIGRPIVNASSRLEAWRRLRARVNTVGVSGPL